MCKFIASNALDARYSTARLVPISGIWNLMVNEELEEASQGKYSDISSLGSGLNNDDIATVLSL